jgi:hypothetical protein
MMKRVEMWLPASIKIGRAMYLCSLISYRERQGHCASSLQACTRNNEIGLQYNVSPRNRNWPFRSVMFLFCPVSVRQVVGSVSIL